MNTLRLVPYLLAGSIAAVVVGTYWSRSRRKTDEQREIERRVRLTSVGRITDGTVLEVREYTPEGASPVQLLIYSYDVAGVSYECSQDITQIRQLVNLLDCQIGIPASIKYDPQNPGNSIVVAESWSGLRT